MSYVFNLNRNSGAETYNLSAAAAQPTRRNNHSLSLSAASSSGTDDTDVSKFSQASQRLAASLAGQGSPLATNEEPAAGALQHATTLLTRMSELKSLHEDESTTDEDRSAYEEEFSQLQDSLTSLGLGLFDPRAGEAEDNADAGTELASPETPGPLDFTDDFTSADNWLSTNGDLSVSDQTLYPNAAGGFGSIQSRQSFNGNSSFEVNFDLYLPGAADSLELSLGGAVLSNLTDGANISKWGWHSVRIAVDGNGQASTYVDGSDEAADTRSDLGGISGTLGLANYGEGSARIRNFSLKGTAVVPPATVDDATASASVVDDSSSASEVVDAEDLASLDAGTIADALDEVAAQQAESESAVDATDASDPLAAAADAILNATDADEATYLARQSILLDSGLAFAAQANLDQEAALYLVGAE